MVIGVAGSLGWKDHHYEYLKDFISIIGEQSSSKKINHYVAGTNIKIVDSKIFKKERPDLETAKERLIIDGAENKK